MTRWELLKMLDEQYPFDHQEAWDNCGANVGPDYQKSVTGVVLALDVTSEVIEQAKITQSNVIVTHHPLLMNDEKNPASRELFKKLQEQDLVHVALHTCFDLAPEGTSYQLAQMLEQGEVHHAPNHPYIVTVRLGVPMHLNYLIQFLNRFPIFTSLRYDKTMSDKTVETVAIAGGSGASFLGDVFQMDNPKVDCYLTGDVKWHTYIDAKEMGLAIVDIGHASEYIFVRTLKKILEARGFPVYEMPLTVQIVEGKQSN